MIDIDDVRKRNRCAILNTATGKALGKALDEIKWLRDPRRIAATVAQWADDNDLETSSEMDCELADRIISEAAREQGDG